MQVTVTRRVAQQSTIDVVFPLYYELSYDFDGPTTATERVVLLEDGRRVEITKRSSNWGSSTTWEISVDSGHVAELVAEVVPAETSFSHRLINRDEFEEFRAAAIGALGCLDVLA